VGLIQEPDYEIVNGTALKLDPLHLRVSINDMYIIWSITWKTIRGAAELGATWSGYAADRSEEDKKARAAREGCALLKPSPLALLPSINRLSATC
jgi:hypothetical protein